MRIACSSLALAALMMTSTNLGHVAFAQSGTRQPSRPAPRREPPSARAQYPVALNGYCPVCVVGLRKWVPGRPELTAVYDGQSYRFPGQEQKATFESDPEKFAPVLNGDSVVSFVKAGKRVRGNLNFSQIYDGRLYLLSSNEERRMFQADPKAYADADLAYGGKCPVCRVATKEDVPGKPEYTVRYKGLRYLFPGPDQRDAFLAGPGKYAVSPSEGRPAPGEGS